MNIILIILSPMAKLIFINLQKHSVIQWKPYILNKEHKVIYAEPGILPKKRLVSIIKTIL